MENYLKISSNHESKVLFGELKGEKYWEQIFQCTQKCEEINSGLK